MALIIYSRRDCPLCDDGLALVRTLALRRGLDVRKVDVDAADPATLQRHRYRVPVVCLETAAGEVELGWGRLDAAELERRLEAALNS